MKKLPAGVRILTPDYYEYSRGTNYARIDAVRKTDGNEEVVGRISFQTSKRMNEAFIDYIEVVPEFRHTSLGSRLFLSMVADTAPLPIELGGLTPDGVAFFKRLFESHPGFFRGERFDAARRAVGLE